MNKKYLTFVIFVMLVSIAAVSAHDNQTLTSTSDDVNLNAVEVTDTLSQADDDKLETTYYYDEDTQQSTVDSRVITNNVVKYYGDKDTKFTVVVKDSNAKPVKGAEVSFTIYPSTSSYKTTNSKGIASFQIKDILGTRHTNVMVQLKGVKGEWQADNTIKVKSTIIAKDLVKFSTSKKKFQISFLDSKGKALKNKYVKLKIKGKTIKVKTNSKGIAKIKSTQFKVGKHKITVYNPASGEERNLSAVVLKKGTYNVNINVINSKDKTAKKKLKNGDWLSTYYDEKGLWGEKGVFLYISGYNGLGASKHTKVTKVKFLFKNSKTGKVISKSPVKLGKDLVKINPGKGYVPGSGKVWYQDKA